MSQRRRMLLIPAIVALVLGGAAYYFLGVHRPARARAEAQAEIAAWEERWLRARTCVVGSSQASASIAEALAIRDLGADLSNRSSCAKIVGDLTRGPGDATQLDEVEVAWRAIDRAAGKVAVAFVQQLGVTMQPERDPIATLAGALEEMDRAHATLRAAAALPALPARNESTLPRGTLLPLALEGAPLEMLEAASITNGAIVARVAIGNGRAIAIHAPGKSPLVMRQDRAIRSLPDLGIGVESTERALALGPLDAAGRMTKPVVTAPLVMPSALFAIGNETAGAVVYTLLGDTRHGRAEASRQDVQLGIARVTSGKLAIAPAHAAHDTRHDVEPGGRALIAWSDRRVIRGALLTPAATGALLELGAGTLGRTDRGCLTATHAWLAIASPGLAGARSTREGSAESIASPGLAGARSTREGSAQSIASPGLAGARSTPEGSAESIASPGLAGARSTPEGSAESIAGRAVAFDATAARSHELADHVLVGCTRDAAVLRARGSLRFAVCRDDCRSVELAAAHPSVVPVLVGEQLVGIAGQRSVLGLWAESGTVRYIALAEPFTPMFAVSDGEVIDILGRTGAALAIARVPAR